MTFVLDKKLTKEEVKALIEKIELAKAFRCKKIL